MGRKKLDRAHALPRGYWQVGPEGTRRAAAALEVRRERNGLEQAGGDGDDGSGWIAGRAAVVEEAEPEVAEALAGPLRPRPIPPLRSRRREVKT